MAHLVENGVSAPSNRADDGDEGASCASLLPRAKGVDSERSPLYLAIRHAIEERIADGTYAPGSAIPPSTSSRRRFPPRASRCATPLTVWSSVG